MGTRSLLAGRGTRHSNHDFTTVERTAFPTISDKNFKWASTYRVVGMSLLTINDLEVGYETDEGFVQAVDDVSFEIDQGEIISLIGESGCGKSTLAKSIVRNLDPNARITSGAISYHDTNLLDLSDKAFREYRWDKIAFIPQDAMNSLDPVYTIKEQFLETVFAHTSMSSREAKQVVEEKLDIVDISVSRVESYPHQLSGGMKQRILLALALVLDPDLVITDEPTTGIDVLLKDKILADIEELREEQDTSFFVVSHDIANMVETSDRALMMYGGKILEKGPSLEVFQTPRHPYTIALKNATPSIHKEDKDLISISMDPPDLIHPPEGCRFGNICPMRVEECEKAHPEFTRKGSIDTACIRADETQILKDDAEEVSWG